MSQSQFHLHLHGAVILRKEDRLSCSLPQKKCLHEEGKEQEETLVSTYYVPGLTQSALHIISVLFCGDGGEEAER